MGANIAVKDCQFSFAVGSGTVSVTSTASEVCKIKGKGIYTGPLAIAISGYNGGSITNADGVATASIPSGSQAVKSSSASAMLEGDSMLVTITGTTTTTAGKTPVSTTDTVKISKAGQTAVKAA